VVQTPVDGTAPPVGDLSVESNGASRGEGDGEGDGDGDGTPPATVDGVGTPPATADGVGTPPATADGTPTDTTAPDEAPAGGTERNGALTEPLAGDDVATPGRVLASPDIAAKTEAPQPRPHEEVPWRIIWTAIAVVLAAGAAIELILALQRVLELLVIASFLAVVLSPAVSLLVRLRLRRGLATTVVFIMGMAAFGGLGYLFIHPLYQQVVRFANDLPGTLARVQAGKGRIGSIVARYHLQKNAATYVPKIRNYLSHLGGPALNVARTVLSGLGGLVLLMILTFLLLLEGPSVVATGLRLLPEPQARRARRVLDDVARSVTGYVIGNFATSVIAGVICAISLLILGVPFAIVFGVWVALIDLLPLVGGLLAGVPTVAFAFLHSTTAGIIMLVVFLIYQQVENHLLNPLIMSRTVKLNPLWVLLSVLAGAELAGFIGALLAIPAAGTIHVIARDLWDDRRGRVKPTPTVGPDETPIA
jgi:predicted PurR-regulated permease PerM